MIRAIAPWYESHAIKDWITSPYLKENHAAFFHRTLLFPFTPHVMGRFMSEHVYRVIFGNLDGMHGIKHALGYCEPYSPETWLIRISDMQSRDEKGRTLVHELLHGFYRSYGCSLGGLIEANMARTGMAPEGYDRPLFNYDLRTPDFADARVEEMAQDFYRRNKSYVMRTLETLLPENKETSEQDEELFLADDIKASSQPFP